MDLLHAARFAGAAAATAAALILAGCADPTPTPPLKGQVEFTVIHTADIHSRLFPYDFEVGQTDSGLGLGPANAVVNIGGAAEVSYLVGRERARSSRVLHLDGGDCFDGAPIFHFFNGEPEVRAESLMGTDAMVVANHEFDHGALNLGIQLQHWANFPVLAANYLFEDPSTPGASPLGAIVQPFTVLDVDDLKVGVIGMGNLSSLGAVFSQPNRLGITPLDTTEVAQFYVDLLRPEVDVIIVLSHLGIEIDEQMIQSTSGIDVVLGAHNHIVLQPPKQLQDCSLYGDTQPDGSVRNFIVLDGPTPQSPTSCSANADCPAHTVCYGSAVDLATGSGACGCQTDADCGYDGYCFGATLPDATGTLASTQDESNIAPICKLKRYCSPRNVVLAHSGAFAKYVGRLDFIFSNQKEDLSPTYNPEDGFEVVSTQYQLFPVTSDIPTDPAMSNMLQPYAQSLDSLANLDLLVGYALAGSKRTPVNNGDSPLGNLISTAMQTRLGIQTDFALTNTTGIRADLLPGPVTIEEMFNIFPFDNTITKMQLSGLEVQELLDFVASRSAGRGCFSQAQIAGARVVFNCDQTARDNNPSGYNVPATCVTDSDCTPGGIPGGFVPTCQPAPSDPTTKVCFCENDLPCPLGYPGIASNIYIGSVSPPACASDADCAAGKNPLGITQSCDPTRKICICQNDAQCPASLPPRCATDADCNALGFAETCDTETKLCACEAGQFCPTAGLSSCDLQAGICYQPIAATATYDLATSNYIAAGGSGFGVLSRNTTQLNTQVLQRDALTDYIQGGAPCGADDEGNLTSCSHDKDCNGVGEGYVCACPESVIEGVVCQSNPSVSCAGKGQCVLAQCRDDVAAFQRATCASAPDANVEQICENNLVPCRTGGEECKFLACVGNALGNYADGRIKMVGQ
jgi:2',3'-cyclic-nucleotide 2'-phosphodiesterase (5'-nucleotidase family)